MIRPSAMDNKRVLQWALLWLAMTQTVCGFKLTILHTNDVHARVEETNKHSGRCSSSDAANDKCYAGMARLKSKIDELRAKYPDSILLDAGDQYQGTLFFTVYGGQVMSHFMNILGYDAMALGNHEFDSGVAGLEPFVQNASFDVLSSNMDASKAPQLSAVRKSVVIDVQGQRVGVIGYTTTVTPVVSKPGPVKFLDEVQSIQAEVNNLTGQGVNKIIALGHAGFAVDLKIAKEVSGVDVVIGGHTNTFLYTGDAPAHEDPVGLYPTVVKSLKGGNDVLVVQDYAFGKYLGFLQVDFDDQGVATSWTGNPILMNSTVPKDQQVVQLIQGYLPQLEKMKTEKVGVSLVFLEGDRNICRSKECNMGNLIADAMVRQNHRYADGIKWNHVTMAIVNSGGIRASIPKGDIMTADVMAVAPFGNTVDIVELTGSVIWETLEHSVYGWKKSGGLSGAFLQVSGIRVVYDMTQKPGNRVVELKVVCPDCSIPEFKPIVLSKRYNVLVPSFLVNGGDSYSIIKDNAMNSHTIGDLDVQLLLDYIKENSPIAHGLDNRIQTLHELQKAAYCGASRTAPIMLWMTASIMAMYYL